MTLDGAVQRALEHNPDVQAADAEVDAAEARRRGAVLPFQHNPEASVAAGPRFGRREDDIDYDVTLTQPIEIAGQRGARIDATSASLAAAKARLAERRANIAAQVREAFGRVLAAEAHEKLAEDALQLATQAVAAASERYRAGDASLIEANTARVELGRSNRARLSARRRRAAAAAELKLLVGAETAVRLSLDGQLQTLPRRQHLDGATLHALAAEKRPDLIAARQDLESAQAEERLAAREGVPTPRVGVSVEREEEAEIVQGVLSVDLPVFNRNQAARGVSAARVRQAKIAVATLERQVAADVELSAGRLHAAREAVEGFTGDVLRALDENTNLTTKAYESGKIDFLQLLLIRRESLDASQDYIDALDELNAAEAQLDRVLGFTPGLGDGRP